MEDVKQVMENVEIIYRENSNEILTRKINWFIIALNLTNNIPVGEIEFKVSKYFLSLFVPTISQLLYMLR